MKKIAILILLINLYPFGCEAQTNCDKIESEAWYEAEKKYTDEIRDLKTDIDRLGDIIEADGQKMAEMDKQIQNQANQIKTLLDEQKEFITQIGTLTETNNALRAENDQLREDLANSEGRVDTITVESEFITIQGQKYRVADIEMIKPKIAIDTILVTHCADSTKNTVWYHHGGVEAPYPKDITFATKELAMTRILFKSPLTDSIKASEAYRLKRIRDHENAKTTYEYIDNIFKQ